MYIKPETRKMGMTRDIHGLRKITKTHELTQMKINNSIAGI